MKHDVGPLAAAGANGADVDAHCRTSLPGSYAIGDCAGHENRFADGARVRLESVQNANDQANMVEKSIVGHEEVEVRGSVEVRSFSVACSCPGRSGAPDCVDAVKDYVQDRKTILKGFAPVGAA
jgi:3-phenylpropionate/trans-cinnamate dioxygenase ferredoxin reductase subunit